MIASIFVFALLLTSALSHQLKNDDTNDDTNDDSNDGEIRLGDNAFASKKAFFATGGRCRTQDMSQMEREIMDLKLLLVPGATSTEEASSPVTKVQVFFHILTSSPGAGDITSSVLNKQIDVLNRDHASSNSKFAFELAGVDRTANDAWYAASLDSSAERDMKSALRKGSYADLNIYTTAQSDSTLGWATYPGSSDGDFSQDGVIVDFRTFPGGSFFPYNEGRTVTHEVGHWLGLLHTFQDGCVTSEGDGDEISDTPAVKEPNAGCPAGTNSCPGNNGGLQGNDPIHNYMDYTDDSCMNNFTTDQVARMRRSWVAYRNK